MWFCLLPRSNLGVLSSDHHRVLRKSHPLQPCDAPQAPRRPNSSRINVQHPLTPPLRETCGCLRAICLRVLPPSAQAWPRVDKALTIEQAASSGCARGSSTSLVAPPPNVRFQPSPADGHERTWLTLSFRHQLGSSPSPTRPSHENTSQSKSTMLQRAAVYVGSYDAF